VVSPKYLVDTDWVIFYLRGKEPFVSTLKEYHKDGLAISVVSLAELYEGVYRSDNRISREKGLKDFLTGVEILGVDRHIARLFGKHRADLRRQGLPLADFDILIGCTALHHNLVLLTNNRRHYERIAGISMRSLGT
jgi:tRNA(fMet)-specific endonuclease VapC